MNFIFKSTTMMVAITTTLIGIIKAENFTGNMVKMCLFYPSPSGHVRTDPILSQTCPSDHVHTVSLETVAKILIFDTHEFKKYFHSTIVIACVFFFFLPFHVLVLWS
jgi:hypothetical protein